MLTETEKAYLAGLFDGDGCVTINKIQLSGRPNPAHCLSAQYAQKERSLLVRWQEKTGLGNVYEHSATGGSQWIMNGQDAETFLTMVLPYLDLKRTEAEIGLKFRKTQHGRASRHQTPAPIIELRERYRQMMQDAKGHRGDLMELSDALQEYEVLLDSQIELPGF